MPRGARSVFLQFVDFRPWIVAAVTILSVHLAADALWEFLLCIYHPATHPIETYSVPVLVGHLCFLWLMLCLLYRQKKAFYRPVTQHLENKSPYAKKHLILFLSSLRPGKELVEGVPKWLNLTFDLKTDIAEMERIKNADRRRQWRWEMPLRAIKHHLMEECPETVTIICSQKSITQVHWFYGICSEYAEFDKIRFQSFVSNRPHLQPTSSHQLSGEMGWDFESFDTLSKALAGLLKTMLKRGYEKRDIIVDFTGGQKVTSVVAAAMTFNMDMEAQYVQTASPWKVLSYDVVYGSGDTGEFGM